MEPNSNDDRRIPIFFRPANPAAIDARWASRAHCAALIRMNGGGLPIIPPGEPATSSNSLSTGPGHTWVTTTPVPARSARRAFGTLAGIFIRYVALVV
jgi:hypothetical protein